MTTIRTLWQDDRPVPASTGRRMLRVFGRLLKSVGLLGLIAVVFMPGARTALFATDEVTPYMVALTCVGLFILGLVADFVDAFIAGLREEE